MVVLFIALLHGLASALLHERIFSGHTVQVILREENRGSGSSQTENNVEDWLRRISNEGCSRLSHKKSVVSAVETIKHGEE